MDTSLASSPSESYPPGWPSVTSHTGRWDERGLSLRGLRLVAESARGRSSAELWREDWMAEMAPPGWTAKAIFEQGQGEDQWQSWVCDRLECTATGEIREKTPESYGDDGNYVAPPGCQALIDVRPELAEHIGKATHFLSYPWLMPFVDVVAAADRAVDGQDDAFFFLDRLCLPYHNARGVRAEVAVCEEAIAATQLVQVLQKWGDVNSRMSRLWLLLESTVAVAHQRNIILVMLESEQEVMADALRDSGPEVILDMILTDIDPEKAFTGAGRFDTRHLSYRSVLADAVHDQVKRVGGVAQMELKLGDHNRKAFAAMLDKEFERRWELAGCTASEGVAVAPQPASRQARLSACDLGHQLACLWALTSKPDRAEELFRRVLSKLKDISAADAGAGVATPTISRPVARVDSTSAELVKLLKQGGTEEGRNEAHTVQREASSIGKLPVSWEGVSVAFLKRFYEEHATELAFLSTDAVVERLVKPLTHTGGVMFDPSPKGVALIETIHHSYRGAPNFFLTHAWRQTFFVPESAPWRGGLAQAIVDVVPEAERASTYFWFDIFNVNQHQTSLAFAFEPLRNAIIDCDHLKVFMETWDDPAPLSRVWCLDELRNALLLGKEVKICMPTQAMRTFRENAAAADNTQTITAIKRVCGRVSIEHASATRESDRSSVLDKVESTLNYKFMNEVCREIIKNALLDAAGLDRAAVEETAEWSKRWREIFQERIDATEAMSVPHTIEVKRAVAMMQRRLYKDQTDSAEYREGTQLLRSVQELTRRYYGTKSQLYSDIVRQFSSG